MSALFHEIPDAFVILLKGGVYRQSKVYRRGDDLFAGYSGGFVRLSEHGTSVPNLRIVDVDLPFEHHLSAQGRWQILPVKPKRRRIAKLKAVK